MASSFRNAITTSAEVVKRLEEGNKDLSTIQKQNKEHEGNGGGSQQQQDDSGSLVPEEPSPSDSSTKTNAKLVSDVLKRLERLIVSDDWVNNPKVLEQHDSEVDVVAKKNYSKHLPHLDELGRTVITSYSLQAYIKLLPRNHSFSVATHLHKFSSDVLAKFLRFSNGVARFHDDFYTGFSLAVKLAKKQIFHPNSLASDQTGVVYLSPGLPYPDVPQFLDAELGVKYVTTLPAMNTPFMAVDSRLDVSAFEKILEEDALNKKVPLLVVAVVGSSVFGHNDLVSKLLELRERYRFWLHLIGLNVAALAISEPQEHLLRVIQSTDSFTAPLGSWLGVHGLPHLTLHKRVESMPLHYSECLESLPWWIVVNDLGAEAMKKRLDEAYFSSKLMLKCLSKFPQLEIIGLGSISDVLSRIEKKSLTPPAVLTFKYMPNVARVLTEPEKSILDDDYVDCLNIWLGQGVIHDCPNLALQLIDLSASKLGTALRYCPLESTANNATTAEHVNMFGKRLEATLSILDVTVKSKLKLPEILVQYPELKPAKLPKWAGVSGLIFIPTMLRGTSEWNDKQKEQVSHLNIELVHALRASDSAFTLGDSEEGVTCVKLGMLADEKDLIELINLVLTKGKEIEESSQYIESLAAMVKQGIEAANEDLRKENESRLMQEGVLRQVPVVSYVLNWWSPLPKEATNVKGRAFDLKTGRILSTDAVYKHKLMVDVAYDDSPEVSATHRGVRSAQEAVEDEEGVSAGNTTAESTSSTETSIRN